MLLLQPFYNEFSTLPVRGKIIFLVSQSLLPSSQRQNYIERNAAALKFVWTSPNASTRSAVRAPAGMWVSNLASGLGPRYK